MSSFVNSLKRLLSGLLSFLGGIFSSKKSQDAIAEAAPKPRKSSKSGYFLELEDAKGIGRDSATSTTASEPVAAAPQPAATVESTPAAASSAKAESTEPQPSAEHAKPRRAKPKQSVSKTSESSPAEPAAAAAALNLPKPTVTTFAPNYLVPTASSNGRRRPGANMSSFLDMARQVKTSS